VTALVFLAFLAFLAVVLALVVVSSWGWARGRPARQDVREKEEYR